VAGRAGHTGSLTWRDRRRPAVGGIDWRNRRGSVAAIVLLMFGIVPAVIASSPAERPGSGAAEALAARGEAVDTPARSTRPADPPAAAHPAPQPATQPAPQPQAAAPSASPEPEPAPEPAPTPEPEPSPEPEPAPEPAPEPQPPAPVGGLNQRQMEHAATIVRVGRQMGLPAQAYVVALATALQESYLRVLANPTYPESSNLPHDGTGSDHDSVGIFQQRPASGWGTVAECMDPENSARSFYRALQQVPGWQNLPVTVAAQAVQVSAFPDHYAKHEPLARQLVAALT
jgi:hypothetical protein